MSDVHGFYSENRWQKSIRDKVLKPYYQKISHEGRFVFSDKGKLSTILQREMAIDTIVQSKENSLLSIEEKIVRWPGYIYEAYVFETWSCTNPGMERQGWMHYAECDCLLYCFIQADLRSLWIHSIPFKKLQDWFFSNDQYKNYRIFRTQQLNHTETRIVPITDVWDAIPGCETMFVNEKDKHP